MQSKEAFNLRGRFIALLAALGLGACAAQPVGPTPLLDTHWRAVEIQGQPVVLGEGMREPHLVLAAEGNRVNGSSGCNRLMGTYELDKQSLRFIGLASTRMGCAPPVMELEGRFLTALRATAMFRQDGDRLELRDTGSGVVMRLEARAPN